MTLNFIQCHTFLRKIFFDKSVTLFSADLDVMLDAISSLCQSILKLVASAVALGRHPHFGDFMKKRNVGLHSKVYD